MAYDKEKTELLQEASSWWDQLGFLREEYALNASFLKGDQWGEIYDPDRKGWISEKQFLEERGLEGFVFNLFANIVRNVIGQFRQNRADRHAFAVNDQDDEATEALNVLWRYVRRKNMSHALEADGFRDHVLAGMSCWKLTVEFDPLLDRMELAEYLIAPSRISFNLDVADRRLQNLRIITELHDLTPDEVYMRFAKSEKEMAELERVIGQLPRALQQTWGSKANRSRAFLYPDDGTKVRVLEVWYRTYKWKRYATDPLTGITGEIRDLKAFEEEQRLRKENMLPLLKELDAVYEPVWNVCFTLPDGYVLEEKEEPYMHGEHPYAFSIALIADGDIISPVRDLRDPQRWINRQFALLEYYTRSAAKGALAVDQEVLEDSGLTLERVAEWYTSTDAVLAFRVNPRQGKTLQNVFHSVQSPQIPGGYLELISVLLSFTERISGVSEATRGLTPKSGTPAALYQQQILQSTLNITDLLETYFEGLEQKDRKTLKLIKEIYTQPMRLRSTERGDVIFYDPERIRNLVFDVSIGSVQETVTTRVLWDPFLVQLFQAGALPLDVLLKNLSVPVAKKLLSDLQASAPQMGGVAGGKAPVEMEQMQPSPPKLEPENILV